MKGNRAFPQPPGAPPSNGDLETPFIFVWIPGGPGLGVTPTIQPPLVTFASRCLTSPERPCPAPSVLPGNGELVGALPGVPPTCPPAKVPPSVAEGRRPEITQEGEWGNFGVQALCLGRLAFPLTFKTAR